MSLSRSADVKKIRQKNMLSAVPPPAIIERAPSGCSEYVFLNRKVQKGGAINLARLVRGARVNIVEVADQVFVVSSRPQCEVEQLIAHLPQTKPSPYAELNDRLRGRPHTVSETRVTHGLAGSNKIPELNDETAMRLADVSRAMRLR